jgi:hypothetical protein
MSIDQLIPAPATKYSIKNLRPHFLNDLIRVGNVRDGGYLVNRRAIVQSRYLISFGVSDDWSFEADFLRLQPNLKVLCFDHSVSKEVFRSRLESAVNEILSLRFVLSILSLRALSVRRKLSYVRYAARTLRGFSTFFSLPGVKFVSKGVSNTKNDQVLTLCDVFQMIPSRELVENSVFLKMDIEQSEYRVLPDLAQFEQFVNGLVIEFHDLDILWPQFTQLINDLRVSFEITHIHGNNFGGLIPASTTPRVLEITLVKRALISERQSVQEGVVYPLPGLDRPINESAEDYPLYF